MAKAQMTKFVANGALYLRQPTDDQVDTVLVWMTDRKLEITSIKEGEAIFTPSGKGKPAPAVEIQFTAPTDPSALDKLTSLYPGPISLAGVKMIDPEDEVKSPDPGEVNLILAEAGCIPAHSLMSPVSEEQSEGMDGLTSEEPEF